MARPRRGERRQTDSRDAGANARDQPGRAHHHGRSSRAPSAFPRPRCTGISPARPRCSRACIEFIEETLFTRINKIIAEESRAEARVQNILSLLLGFANNPRHGTPAVRRRAGALRPNACASAWCRFTNVSIPSSEADPARGESRRNCACRLLCRGIAARCGGTFNYTLCTQRF